MKLIDKMRELVAAQKKNHKSIIDWDSFFEDNAIMELRALQKDLKYFASVGKMKQATKTFENLKLCYKNYHAINAA